MDEAKKNDLIVKVVCVLLSFALWIYLISSTNTEINIRITDVPVKIVNAESLKSQNLILLPDNQPKTSIMIKGPATNVYNANISDFMLTVDLSSIPLKEGDNKVKVTPDRLPAYTALFGSPPEVIIKVDKLVEKSLEIKKDRIKYAAVEGLFVPEPYLDPSIAVVTGPEEYVSKVAALMVDVDKKDISGTSKVASRVIPVDADGNEVPNVVSLNSHVEVTFNAYNIKEVEVDVKSKNTLDKSIFLEGYIPKPSKVKITARDSVLRNISLVETMPLDLSLVKLQTSEYPGKINVPQEVILLDNNGKPMDPDITIFVKMDSITGKEVEKAITMVGTPKGKASLTSDKVSILVSGSKEKINQLNVNSIEASVDVEGLEPGEYDLDIKVTPPVDYLVKGIKPNKVRVKIEAQ